MIVKVQRSISSSDGSERVLIYNRDRTIIYSEDITEEVKQLFPDGVYKLYFRATFQEGNLSLDHQVPQQDF